MQSEVMWGIIWAVVILNIIGFVIGAARGFWESLEDHVKSAIGYFALSGVLLMVFLAMNAMGITHTIHTMP